MSTSISSKLFPWEGKIWGHDHWEEVKYQIPHENRVWTVSGMTDKSTGLVYVNRWDHHPVILRQKAVVVIATAAPYFAATLAFHILRVLPATLYLVGKSLYKRNVQPLHQLRKELLFSIKSVAWAPIYFMGYLLGAIYMLYDPLNGKKIVAAYEYRLNHEIAVENSVHLLYPKKNFLSHLKKQGLWRLNFYGPGCFQPIAKIKEGQIYRSEQWFGKEAAEAPWVEAKFSRQKQADPLLFDRLDLQLPLKGSIFGKKHWKLVRYEEYEEYIDTSTLDAQGNRMAFIYQKKSHYEGYIDTSTLDTQGNGMAFIYQKKSYGEWFFLAIGATLMVPVHALVSLTYNVLRIVPVTTYIALCLLYEKGSGKQLFADDRRFKVSDIRDQVILSICNIVRLPFYTVGLIFGLLYSFVDPMNGRKVIEAVERGRNRGRDLERSYWSVAGERDDYAWEGGGRPSELGYGNGFYLLGCCQPKGEALYQNGVLQTMVSSGGNHTYKQTQIATSSFCPTGCIC